MRARGRCCVAAWIAGCAGLAAALPCHGAEAAPADGPSTLSATDYGDSEAPRLESLLPPQVARTFDINAWGWLTYVYSNQEGHRSYWVGDLALGGTQRFGDRVAVSADMHFLDDNNHLRGFLEQAFVSAKLSESTGTLLTAGKFNANFGVEPRDAWDRLGGTTSLLFGAQPQDLIGVMLTQPIGDTGVTVRPFIANGFEGQFNFDQSPSVGFITEYRPRHELTFSVTNWIGRGFVMGPAAAASTPTEADYTLTAFKYGIWDWVGPRLHGQSSGTLYLLDASVTWLPRPDLTLAAEGLFAANGPSAGRAAWGGLLALANYDITDRWRVFGRWSFLNDAQGIVTGAATRLHELSAGVGFEIISGLELRGEYRHDFSAKSADVDFVSAHITFSY
jgi:hypothetical protein